MPHGANLGNSSATLPGGNPTGQGGLVCWPRPGIRHGKTATIGAARLHVAVARLLQYPARPCWDTAVAGCPTVSQADGHGMILIERRVVLEDATYRVAWAGPGL